MSGPALIDVRDVSVTFPLGGVFRRKGMVAVRGVSFTLAAGETLGLVGESGSGKSTVARVLLGLERPSSGRVEQAFQPRTEGERRSPARIQVVFQDSEAALDPRMTVLESVAEPLRAFGVDKRTAQAEAVRWLDRVGLPAWQQSKYPRQLSGGQRQRVCIARAVIGRPDVLVADEALSALDVSLQAQLVELLAELRADLELAMVFVSHDLSIVRHVADRVGVMYLGHLVEYGPTATVFDDPHHPYTKALLASVPDPEIPIAERFQLQGEMPSALSPPSGCVFRTRCPLAREQCAEVMPDPHPGAVDGHWARCLFSHEVRRLGVDTTAQPSEITTET
jgi:oligopeptide/dipeptide ABC transporter ATP-binding protein